MKKVRQQTEISFLLQVFLESVLLTLLHTCSMRQRLNSCTRRERVEYTAVTSLITYDKLSQTWRKDQSEPNSKLHYALPLGQVNCCSHITLYVTSTVAHSITAE